jgi:hypothetical protein
MIGVVARADQTSAVQEFFELFKTPWEPYVPGRSYDVVIAPRDRVPRPACKLLVVHGASSGDVDTAHGLVELRRTQGGTFHASGRNVPIYGDVSEFTHGPGATPCVHGSGVLGVSMRQGAATIVRLGYDLFDEVSMLIAEGQPATHAAVPTLDIHVQMLRDWIARAGVALIEIPPAPAGFRFVACLTHDIDFVGIRRHLFDHTMWGFLWRATAGAARNVWRGRLPAGKLFETWRAVASLPAVYLGLAKDFWEPFDWYLRVEGKRPATYYLIPFKHQQGTGMPGPRRSRRAVVYDIADIPGAVRALLEAGCEIGVHGIDAWHNPASARAELERVVSVTGSRHAGVRMHWLFRDAQTPATLDEAGYMYDSTGGYNETIGYRNGTTQVFRPLGARMLLELPLHIQDGALFFANRLDLPAGEAYERCRALFDHAASAGGVMTLLWHDRSHAPERFWGDFYRSLLHRLDSYGVWFATARQAVEWFRARRMARFESASYGGRTRVRLRYDGPPIDPPLKVVLHCPSHATPSGMSWNGSTPLECEISTVARAVGAAV